MEGAIREADQQAVEQLDVPVWKALGTYLMSGGGRRGGGGIEELVESASSSSSSLASSSSSSPVSSPSTLPLPTPLVPLSTPDIVNGINCGDGKISHRLGRLGRLGGKDRFIKLLKVPLIYLIGS